ncbi:MAG: hypothetical protein QOE56_495 [Solirubrobacterales bacterium]|jgi:cytoskeletal protein RodZ|nr:hypothetical protein [Solirubrobacterales bacterium]
MDEFDKHRRKQEARRRLRAQQRRAGQLRGRVVVISLFSFVLLWAVVFVQMETGNDPVLGDNSAAAAVSRSSGPRGAAKAQAHPAETEAEFAEPEGFEEEPGVVEVEPETVEPEAELEPLTTSQS